MNMDDLPEQLEELFDRARALLDHQINRSRATLEKVNAEKASAQNALADLQAQCKEAKADLDRSREYLARASTLAALDREIEKDRAELAQLNAATAKEGAALEALVKQRTAAQAHVVALENDARQATAERCRAQEMIAQMRKQLGVVSP